MRSVTEALCASVTHTIASFASFFFFLGYSVRKCGPDVRREGKSTRNTPGSERREISRRDEREKEEGKEEEVVVAEKKEEEGRTNTREETR